ncbi:MAG: hypothetical protein AAGI88_06280 [Pseudomonadota bacterium]
MLIEVPRPESKTLALTLRPKKPVAGTAQVWKLGSKSIAKDAHITGLQISFSSASSQSERLSESLTMKINSDPTVQTRESIWRFMPQGLFFATNAGD